MKNIKKILIIMMIMIAGFGFSDGDVLAVQPSGVVDNAPTFSGGANNSPAFSGGADNAAVSGVSLENNQMPQYTRPAGIPKVSLMGIVLWLTSILNNLIYLMITAALVVFLYGILKLAFIDGSKPEAREQARKFMFWGIVALFVMVSVWGLVNILKTTFFGSGPLIVPSLK